MAWVGEQGPELVNLPRGSQVIPNSALGGGGHNSHWYIDARGADPAAIARLEKLMPVMRDQAVAVAVSMVNERNLRTPKG
jgi:hypothetical protein